MSVSVSVTSSNADNIDSILVAATGGRGLSSIVMAVMVSGWSTLERGRSARPAGCPVGPSTVSQGGWTRRVRRSPGV